ncbi:hypothetical protein FB451DRAFT_564192 [Mycena latifolia]|nr:hypothetical protein FB451DRAFT_564192 [Mycena latifolia]
MSLPVSHDAVAQAVEQALAGHRVLRRIAAVKRTAFAVDLALIALACRCAWLVDVVAVQDAEHVFADLLRILRQDPIFDGVEHLFEPGSQQSFFVNTARCEALAVTPNLGVSFVLLGLEPRLLAEPPPDVLAALRALAGTHPPALPPALSPRILIPLAGVLLGYPVAYVPAANAADAPLAQTPLDVYTCFVAAHHSQQKHTLLKFSCPAGLPGLAPPQLVEQLTTRFAPRARELGLELIVDHGTAIMDRVAL